MKLTEDEIYFNIDGATYFNMLDGMSFEEAQVEAIKEFKEMQAENSEVSK
jgi:hypothetical protein